MLMESLLSWVGVFCSNRNASYLAGNISTEVFTLTTTVTMKIRMRFVIVTITKIVPPQEISSTYTILKFSIDPIFIIGKLYTYL